MPTDFMSEGTIRRQGYATSDFSHEISDTGYFQDHKPKMQQWTDFCISRVQDVIFDLSTIKIYRTMKKMNVVYAFLLGAAIGGTTALLFAPEKGEKTRKKIRKAVKKEKEKLMDVVDSIVPHVKRSKDELIKAKDIAKTAAVKEIKDIEKEVKGLQKATK